MESSDAMVVLISAAAAKSPHTRQEIEYALSQPRFADRLVPVEAGEAVAKVLADRLEVTTA